LGLPFRLLVLEGSTVVASKRSSLPMLTLEPALLNIGSVQLVTVVSNSTCNSSI
jgi:hypothetical protein